MLPITVSPSPLPCSVLSTATVSWASSRLTLHGTEEATGVPTGSGAGVSSRRPPLEDAYN